MPYIVGKAFMGPERRMESGERIEDAVALSWRNLDALVSARYLCVAAPEVAESTRAEGRKGR